MQGLVLVAGPFFCYTRFMDNYMFNELQSNDTQLLSAIDIELAELADILELIEHKLITAYDYANDAHELQEADLDMVSPLMQTKAIIMNAVDEVRRHKLYEPPSDEYVRNIAAHMSPQAAADLKEKHNFW